MEKTINNKVRTGQSTSVVFSVGMSEIRNMILEFVFCEHT